MMKKKSLLSRPAVQSVLASLLCILAGILVGFIVLLLINPAGAGTAIVCLLQNFLTYPSAAARTKYLGNTLAKTAPLLMCALSVQFCYKVGLFNIGAAGQYVAGSGLALYGALVLKLPWFPCLLLAAAGGALLGLVCGVLKAYRNVNEVICGIMLNWISLYLVNTALTPVKEMSSNYTEHIPKINEAALLPSMGLDKLFSGNNYVSIAIPLAILAAVVIWVIQNMTVFGYELRATGLNRDAAKYAGMREMRNTVLSLTIGGMLAGIGGAFMYLTDYEQWSVTMSSVPGMGFSGIAATFLGALHPIGTIFASFFIEHITSGGAYIDKSLYPSQVSDLMSSVIIYLCSFVLFFKLFLNKRTGQADILKIPDHVVLSEEDAQSVARQDAQDVKGGDAT